MRIATWMGPWDLHAPHLLAAELNAAGIDEIRMAYAYHGSRLYLPRHPHRRVYELPTSAVYFAADLARFGRLRPACAGAIPNFGRPHSAWLVICHNDWLGKEHPECCVRNAHGDTYSYALCPAHPDVQNYAVELCLQASRQPGVTELDLEAVSFMGFEHQGLHEKRGVFLTETQTEMLSVCFCEHCAPKYQALQHPVQSGEQPDLESVYRWRRQVLLHLLRRIRTACPDVMLNLRVSPDRRFTGGKSSFDPTDLMALHGLIDSITLTFFGTSASSVAPVLAGLPSLPYPVHAGFQFHAPDCAVHGDREIWFRELLNSSLESIVLYS